MAIRGRLEVRFPLKDMMEAHLDAPADSPQRSGEYAVSDTVNGRDIGSLGRAMRWANYIDDRIEEALVDLGCKHTDSGTGFGYRDIGFDIRSDRVGDARTRLLDMLAANGDVPARTGVSGSRYDDESYDEIDGWNTTVGDYRASL